MKKYATERASTKRKIKKGATRFGRLNANWEIQLPPESVATWRRLCGVPAGFSRGQRRRTRKTVERKMSGPGSAYAARRPTTPAERTASRAATLTAPKAIARKA